MSGIEMTTAERDQTVFAMLPQAMECVVFSTSIATAASAISASQTATSKRLGEVIASRSRKSGRIKSRGSRRLAL